jgi:uncharacterized protein YecA (UPF0149 family)
MNKRKSILATAISAVLTEAVTAKPENPTEPTNVMDMKEDVDIVSSLTSAIYAPHLAMYDRYIDYGTPSTAKKWLGGKNIPAGEVSKQPKEQGRNEPCNCGSGKKHKKCCGK